jgi:hypothetical protein
MSFEQRGPNPACTFPEHNLNVKLSECTMGDRFGTYEVQRASHGDGSVRTRVPCGIPRMNEWVWYHRLPAFVASVLVFSAPIYARPDLSDVEHLSQSDNFRVWIDAEEHFVYESVKNGNHATNNINRMSFLGFDLNAAVTVKVKPKATVNSFAIRPYSANIAGTLENNTIMFTVDRPQKLVVVLNDSYESVLVITANPPHRPPDPEDVEHYYGPGVHHIGVHKELSSGDDVYIAEGAVVEGALSIQHAENVTIRGRGIITCGQWPHKENFKVIRGIDTKNVLIEGITICNAPGWIISSWEGSENLTVRNVKTVGSWLYNTNGVQTGTVGLLVEDCFLQCNDDNFSLNGRCRNGIVRNILFKNIVVEDVAQYGHWVDFQMNQAATAREIAFEDIDVQSIWQTAG